MRFVIQRYFIITLIAFLLLLLLLSPSVPPFSPPHCSTSNDEYCTTGDDGYLRLWSIRYRLQTLCLDMKAASRYTLSKRFVSAFFTVVVSAFFKVSFEVFIAVFFMSFLCLFYCTVYCTLLLSSPSIFLILLSFPFPCSTYSLILYLFLLSLPYSSSSGVVATVLTVAWSP